MKLLWKNYWKISGKVKIKYFKIQINKNLNLRIN